MAAWGSRRAGGGGGPGGRKKGPGGGGGFLGRRVLAREGDIRRGELGREESRKVGEGHPRRSAGRGPWSPGGEPLPAIELVSFV